MSHRFGRLGCCALLSAVPACADPHSSEPGEGPSPSETSSQVPSPPDPRWPDAVGNHVCPACTPQTGGETTDFGGGPAPPCWHRTFVDVASADAAAEGVALVNELTRSLAGTHELPIRWQPGSLPIRGAADDATLKLELEPLPSEARWAERSTNHGVECRPFLQLPANGRLETSDGALAAAFSVMVRAETADYALLDASADLASLEGTLRFAVDPDRGHHGTLQFHSALTSGILRVELTASLQYADEAVHYPGVQPSYSIITARAPLDDCAIDERPIAADEALPELDGNTLDAAWEGFSLEQQALNPRPARWSSAASPEPSDTTLTLDFAATTSAACLRPPSPGQTPPTVGLRREALLQSFTDDRSFEVSLPLPVSMTLSREGRLLQWQAARYATLIGTRPREVFGRTPLEGSAVLSAYVRANYAPPDPDQAPEPQAPEPQAPGSNPDPAETPDPTLHAWGAVLLSSWRVDESSDTCTARLSSLLETTNFDDARTRDAALAACAHPLERVDLTWDDTAD